MDILERYRKIRRRLEVASGVISIIIGDIISSCLGIYSKKFLSRETALSLVIFVVIVIILNNIAVKIADKWYEKNKNEND